MSATIYLNSYDFYFNKAEVIISSFTGLYSSMVCSYKELKLQYGEP